jgi:hypothetical protein
MRTHPSQHPPAPPCTHTRCRSGGSIHTAAVKERRQGNMVSRQRRMGGSGYTKEDGGGADTQRKNELQTDCDVTHHWSSFGWLPLEQQLAVGTRVLLTVGHDREEECEVRRPIHATGHLKICLSEKGDGGWRLFGWYLYQLRRIVDGIDRCCSDRQSHGVCVCEGETGVGRCHVPFFLQPLAGPNIKEDV